MKSCNCNVLTFCISTGYGTLAPSTAAGQVIFMLYAIVGIPLALIFLSHTGSIILKFTHTLLQPLQRRYGSNACRVTAIGVLSFTALLGFIMIPGVVFSSIEAWNFRESVYFALVSLTTVGFGDFVPAQAGAGSISFTTYLYKILSAGWLWLGLALVWSILAEVQKVFAIVIAHAMDKRCFTHTCCCRCVTTVPALEWQESDDAGPMGENSNTFRSTQLEDGEQKMADPPPSCLAEDKYNCQQSLLN